jgi:hypothetical protein
VHDVGEYRVDGDSRLLEPGMVFTIEPGLYIPPDDGTVAAKWRGIGIRTEDDVLVTGDGHEVLTGGLARSADEIEGTQRRAAKASRVRFSGSPPVQATSSSILTPPNGLNAATRSQSTLGPRPLSLSSSSSMSMK